MIFCIISKKARYYRLRFKYQIEPTRAIAIPPIISTGVCTNAKTRPTPTEIVISASSSVVGLFFVSNQTAQTIAVANNIWSDGKPGLFKKDAPAVVPNASKGLSIAGWKITEINLAKR